MTIKTIDALQSLRPKAEWSLKVDGTLIWHDTEQTKPTTTELSDEVVRLQAEYDGLLYSRARAIAYPPIGDQLDALWKGGDDAAAMKVIVDKVKTDNPKPE